MLLSDTGMPARQPLTFSNSSPANLRSPPSRIPGFHPRGENPGRTQQMEQSSRWQTYDCRLLIVDCQIANFLAVAAQAGLFEIRNSAGPKEMLKMKEPPGMYMKTKEGTTNCPAKSTAFSTKMHELRATLHELYRFVGQRCSNSAVIETKSGRCSVPRASCP